MNDRSTPSVGLVASGLLLGIAAGCRSSLGVAVPVITSEAARPRKVAAGVAVVAEIVADKNPHAPSRLQTPSLVGRVVAGLTGAGALARRHGGGPPSVVMPAIAGAPVRSSARTVEPGGAAGPRPGADRTFPPPWRRTSLHSGSPGQRPASSGASVGGWPSDPQT